MIEHTESTWIRPRLLCCPACSGDKQVKCDVCRGDQREGVRAAIAPLLAQGFELVDEHEWFTNDGLSTLQRNVIDNIQTSMPEDLVTPLACVGVIDVEFTVRGRARELVREAERDMPASLRSTDGFEALDPPRSSGWLAFIDPAPTATRFRMRGTFQRLATKWPDIELRRTVHGV